MTDSFFEFDTDLPSLGSGKTKEFDNEICDLPEEEDINQFNEETFDNAIEEDWVAQHEKLAGEIKIPPRNGCKEEFVDPGYKTHEDELENSLSHLVDDDEPEPTHGRLIPKRGGDVSMDNLFGPSSPPGLLNTDELVGGQNIWGSPARDSYMPSQEDGLKNLLKVLQKPRATPPRQTLQDPSIVSAVHAISSSLPNAVTLEELEHGMVDKTPAVPIPRAHCSVQPRVRTLSDIEKEMTQSRKTPSPPLQGFPYPVGTPPNKMSFMTPPPSMPGCYGSDVARVGRGTNINIPPPMPTPGQLSTSAPHSHPVGSPHSQPINRLQRNTPMAPSSQPGQRSQQPGQRSQLGQSSSPIIVQQANPVMHNDIAGSPVMKGSVPPHVSSDHSAVSRVPITTPQHQRIQQPTPHSDPTHHRGHQGHPGHMMPGPGQNINQALFPGQRGPNHDDHNHHHDDFHHNRDHGDFHNRGEFHNRGDFQNNRGDFNNHGDFRGNRGDFHNNRGDFHNNLGDFHSRGEFHNRGDFHNNRGDFHNYRGEFHNNHGDFHNSRGDFHNSRGDFHHRGDFHNHRMDFRGRGEFRVGYNNHGDRGQDGFNPRFRGAGRGYHNDYHSRPRYNSYGDDDYDEEMIGGNRDEFAGLMTKKEKDWVIKIQLMQLQTENPYLDDFYYTSWAMKKIAKERQAKEDAKTDDKSDPKLVIPHLARLETKNYKPVQFENSLGRVTASSVHNPRQIIDIKRTSSVDQEDAKAREVRRFKEMLLDIEKGYDLLLEIDDLEKKALGIPENSRPALFEKRRCNIQTLYNLLHGRLNEPDGVVQFVTIRKGIKLITRTLPLMPHGEGCILLSSLLQQLSVISKKDWQIEVLSDLYSAMSPILSGASLETLVEFSRELTALTDLSENDTNSILTALQNKFGSCVIWHLLSRGEVVYTTQSPVDMDILHQQQWNEFVSLVATTLASLSKDNIAIPSDNFPKATKHVRRVLDKRTFLSVEDKLQLLHS